MHVWQDWAKSWMFVANRPDIHLVARSCPHPPGTHGSVVGVRLPNGTGKSWLTAEYPPQLAQALASIIRPFVPSGNPQFCRPSRSGRRLLDVLKMGGGLLSSALHVVHKLVALRSRWFRRLSDTKQCLKVTASLLVAKNQDELRPYL